MAIGDLPKPTQDFFSKQRERADLRSRAQEQEGQDALKRRFAAMGGLNSGAALKNEQLLRDQQLKARDEAVAPIEQAEFAAGEAQKGRDVQSEQFGKTFGLQSDIAKFEQGAKLRQLDLADRELKAEREDQAFNKAVAAVQAGLPVDLGELLEIFGQKEFNQARRIGPGGSGKDTGGALTKTLLGDPRGLPELVGGLFG